MFTKSNFEKFFQLDDLKRESSSQQQGGNKFIQVNDAEKYFLPFEMACKCESPRVVEVALDCIQVKIK